MNGAFATRPSNVAVSTNSVVVFTCTCTPRDTSSTVPINWFRTDVGMPSTQRTLVARDCVVLVPLQSVYHTQGAAGVCNLTVNSAQLTNAGTFSCLDTESGVRSSAELVVLGNFLVTLC